MLLLKDANPFKTDIHLTRNATSALFLDCFSRSQSRKTNKSLPNDCPHEPISHDPEDRDLEELPPPFDLAPGADRDPDPLLLDPCEAEPPLDPEPEPDPEPPCDEKRPAGGPLPGIAGITGGVRKQYGHIEQGFKLPSSFQTNIQLSMQN